jgi:hypothetical protein
MAAELGRLRGGPRQQVSVDGADALREASAWFSIDGQAPALWEKYSGLYACGGAVGAPGHVRIHANFAHHRDGALRLLGLPEGNVAEREAVAEALSRWRAEDFEAEAARAGLVVSAARGFDDWDAHPQAAALAGQPVVALERIDRQDGRSRHPPEPLPALSTADDLPLKGVRVLDLTRILAGPVAGRTLAAYGADVMLVNSPNLPNIDAVADTSRGKRSVHLDLKTEAGREGLRALVREADVLVQGYRPGALAALGFGTDDLQRLRPGLVGVDLSAYGTTGPWAGRRGFDSLVQTATGFNLAEAEAFGAGQPRALPVQVLDFSAGFLIAFGVQAALWRRAHEGGGWRVGVTLARTGLWLRELGRPVGGINGPAMPDLAPALQTTASGWGSLRAVGHAARFSHTPPAWALPSVRPGTHAPEWPAR